MNDRFKFRVWDFPTDNNTSWKNKYTYFDLMEMDDDEWSSINNQHQILEQCTGVKDKNGNLVYEGDVVKIIDKSSKEEPFIGVVEYTNTASFEANCNGFYMYLHNPKTPENLSTVEKMFCTSLREIEIIGNIHTNQLISTKKFNTIPFPRGVNK